jgi:hypothetical protein
LDKASKFLCLTGSSDEASSYQLSRGTTVLHGNSGTFIFDDGAKGLSMTQPFIADIAVDDWAQVTEFRQEQDETHLTQHLRFHGGSLAVIVRDLDGWILSVDLERMDLSLPPSGLLLLRPHQSGGTEQSV